MFWKCCLYTIHNFVFRPSYEFWKILFFLNVLLNYGFFPFFSLIPERSGRKRGGGHLLRDPLGYLLQGQSRFSSLRSLERERRLTIDILINLYYSLICWFLTYALVSWETLTILQLTNYSYNSTEDNYSYNNILKLPCVYKSSVHSTQSP